MPDEPETRPRENLSQGWEERPDPLGEYERHPAAIRPPPYTDARREELKRGTREKGQQYNVEAVPGPGGKKYVVRGWHMLLACRDLGIEPRVSTPDRELRTDEDVEVYSGAEAEGRHWNATLQALWTKEAVLPVFRARAQARMAGDAAAIAEEERGQSVALASKRTGANPTYVKNLLKIEREAPALYERVRAAVLAGDLNMNVHKAMGLLRAGTGDDGVWHEREPMAPAPRQRPVDPIPPDLWGELDEVKDDLAVSTRAQAIEALLEFRGAEPDRWDVFCEQWRDGHGR